MFVRKYPTTFLVSYIYRVGIIPLQEFDDVVQC